MPRLTFPTGTTTSTFASAFEDSTFAQPPNYQFSLMERILSLLPSTTEVLYALGAEDTLAAVTHECDFPPQAQNKPQVTSARINPSFSSAKIDSLVREQLDDTGTLYALDMDLVRELRPDAVLTQQLCTVCAVGYETVRGAMRSLPEPPEVLNIEPRTLSEVFASFEQIAALIDRRDAGAELVRKLRERFSAIEKAPATRVLFLEWLIPPFSAGHWMAELVEGAGGIPVLADQGSHSRNISWETIAKADFDVLVVSPCGFNVERGMQDIESSPELRKLREERPSLRVLLFDGNHYFSRPGPRLVESAEMLAKALRNIPSAEAGASIPVPYRFC